MMNFTYENQGTNTYLVHQLSETEKLDSMSLGMITNNRIHGFAETVFVQMDNNRFIRYNVSSKISLKQFFQGNVNRNRLVGAFSGIVNGLLAAEEYMIDMNSIMLDTDYIFADVSTCDIYLICVPIERSAEEPNDLTAFFKNIMFSTQFDQTENCDYVARIINFLNSSPIISLNDFRNLLSEVKAQGQQPVQTTVQPTQPVVTKITPNKQPEQAVQPQRVVTPAPAPVTKAAVQPPVSIPTPTPVAPPVGMAVPKPKQAQAPQPAKSPRIQEKPEKEVSFMYLMQHYSKENAALYKAQKEKKKQQKAEAKGASKQVPQPAKPRPAQPQAMPNFAIPGQPAPTPGSNAAPRPPQVAPQISKQMQAQQVVRPQQVPVQPQPVAKPQQAAPQPQSQPVQQPEPAYVPRPQTQSVGMNFGETTVLGGGGIGETTVLGVANNAQQAPQPYLMRVKNNERIPLDKPVFRIGKERSYVDYFVGDNTAVSRSHANIVTKEEQYLIVDTNSTNHTFVNGVMIQSNQAVEIFHGDKIRLANEEFEFYLY
ncbi:MAG: FHA domain-containing protein [Peptococcaceae bacterium]|nr:FHA domain-containing protein [Peptococcaceae bacterium]